MAASPQWDQFRTAILEVLAERSPRALTELYEVVPRVVGLTDEDMRETVASGQPRYKNRIGWMTTYLVKAGAIERPRRATLAITPRGRELVAEGGLVTEERLSRFSEFAAFLDRSGRGGSASERPTLDGVASGAESPLEVIEEATHQIRVALEADILERLRGVDPYAFERLVIQVLRGMGYGKDGTLETTKASGDGGIDGVISQDPLGLDRIYVQAKRFTDVSVQPKDIQAFMGALSTSHGDRGVFITTSSFTKGATETVGKSTFRVELIDGPRLARLMVDAGVGVQRVHVDPVYRIDEDFFEEL